jgi:hypothetical protein
MRTKIPAAIFLVLIAAPAYALSTASALVTIDWTHFTWTTTGNLSLTVGQSFDPRGSSFTSMTPTTAFGTASASASYVNGFVTAAARFP